MPLPPSTSGWRSSITKERPKTEFELQKIPDRLEKIAGELEKIRGLLKGKTAEPTTTGLTDPKDIEVALRATAEANKDGA